MTDFDKLLKDLGESVSLAFPKEVLNIEINHNELMVFVKSSEINNFLLFLRDESTCQFKILIDICGVDYPERPKRFDVVYNLLSLTHNQRIRVKIEADFETFVPSVVSTFSSAGWYEREVWDMYGVNFSGHPDLRRILTDYGFNGHPLRKDFPLSGMVEVRYSESEKRVVYEPVSLTQEFRSFDFMSPWEGSEYILNKDNKTEPVE